MRRGEVRRDVRRGYLSTKHWKKCGHREQEGGEGCGTGKIANDKQDSNSLK